MDGSGGSGASSLPLAPPFPFPPPALPPFPPFPPPPPETAGFFFAGFAAGSDDFAAEDSLSDGGGFEGG